MAQSGYSGGTRRVSGRSSGRSASAGRRSYTASKTRDTAPSARKAASAPSERDTVLSSRRTAVRRRPVSAPQRRTVNSPTSIRKTRKNSEKPLNKPAAKKRTLKDRLVRAGDMDYTLLFIVILIVSLGLIVMLSASAPAGSRMQGDSYYYFQRQLIFILIGFAGMIIVSRINLDSFLELIPKAFIICIVLLVLVLIPGIGVESHGARRWLNIPFIQLQPSELMKPVIAMYIAYLIKKGVLNLKQLKSNFVCLGIITVVAALLMLETHLSGTIVIVGIAVCVMIAGGMPIKPLLIGGAILIALVIVYLQFDSVRMARVDSLIDPFADSQGNGYQISQSIYAIGSGRIFGLGLGQSVQKYSNLPEPYNDFIFSIVCEELGFFGAVVVILLFAALFLKAMKIAINAPDVWSSLTCIGISSQLGIQTFLNMGVAVSIIPNTGVSLPFFSYGGTSILTLLLEMGVLLNISRKSVKD
ncbi:MAG: putative lipid II flippase FtsW [Oscillospiraceae bacterium]|nr:putative lipid II flippase FtsW [Oscillospiraceae bacterium]